MAKTKTQKAMSALGAIGGRATIRKYGKGHMKKLVNSRWAKQRAEEKVEKLKEEKKK